MPAMQYEHRACAVCWATTEAEAATLCRQTQDITGEWNCPGGAEDESYPDGRLRFASAADLAALDAWIERELARSRMEPLG